VLLITPMYEPKGSALMAITIRDGETESVLYDCAYHPGGPHQGFEDGQALIVSSAQAVSIVFSQEEMAKLLKAVFLYAGITAPGITGHGAIRVQRDRKSAQ
jgi:hypothetical protein